MTKPCDECKNFFLGCLKGHEMKHQDTEEDFHGFYRTDCEDYESKS